jgi:hypothetical protein
MTSKILRRFHNYQERINDCIETLANPKQRNQPHKMFSETQAFANLANSFDGILPSSRQREITE